MSTFGAALNDNRPALHRTGMAGKALFTSAARSKGVSGATSKVRARYDVKAEGVLVRYTGKAHLVDRDTKAHFIVPKAYGGSRRRRQTGANVIAGLFGASGRTITGSSGGGRHAILIGGSTPRAFARHPGTKGKHFFDDAKRRSHAELPGVYQRAGVTEPLRKVFG